jgi:hypothetical protein
MSQATSTQSSEPGPTTPEDLSKNEIFDLLRNQRRRFVLHYLKNNPDEEVTIGTLADQVAAWEYAIPLEEVSSTQRKRVYTTLQQSHLPKMDEAGIVEFDGDRGTITPTSVVADLTIYLEIVPGREFAWHEFYLGLGAVCSALMAAVWAGIWPFAFAPPIIWGTVISAAVAISAAVHVYTQRSMGIGAGEAPQVLDHGK